MSPETSAAALRREVIAEVFAAPAPTPLREHRAIMRGLRVGWSPVESGAPDIDAVRPLRGDGPVAGLAARLLQTADERLALRRLVETGRLLPGLLAAGVACAPGRYAVPPETLAWLGAHASTLGVEADGRFDLRAEHLALLRAANWRAVDEQDAREILGIETPELWPMPAIDGKRPYGDMSFYQLDMAAILGEPFAHDANGRVVVDEAKAARLARLHGQTLVALQVMLANVPLEG